jgi:diguanylate cyclase (GGDEF)-like protein
MDVDHFKKVNDTYGHQKGDEILKELASMMKRFCRSNDVAARYGGEEFLLILPETKITGAVQIADRIRLEMEAHRFFHEDREFKVTLSCGVAAFDKERLNTPTLLVNCADNALYTAKHQGRNRTVSGSPDGIDPA